MKSTCPCNFTMYYEVAARGNIVLSGRQPAHVTQQRSRRAAPEKPIRLMHLFETGELGHQLGFPVLPCEPLALGQAPQKGRVSGTQPGKVPASGQRSCVPGEMGLGPGRPAGISCRRVETSSPGCPHCLSAGGWGRRATGWTPALARTGPCCRLPAALTRSPPHLAALLLSLTPRAPCRSHHLPWVFPRPVHFAALLPEARSPDWVLGPLEDRPFVMGPSSVPWGVETYPRPPSIRCQ